MKNQINKILLLIISIFIIPIIVNADMGVPSSYQYEVVVSNPQGAIVYDWEGKKTGEVIPYDKKITVGYEHTINGELYIETYYENPDEDGYFVGMIKFSDTKLFSTEINFSELNKNTENIQYYAWEDTELYKGPSTAYGKIENITIPKGTTIDYTYSAGDMVTLWVYTEYEGTKGWVYVCTMDTMSIYDIKSTVVTKGNGKLMFIGNQNVYDRQGKETGKVKDLEEYEYIYYYLPEPKVCLYYIKDEKIEGWVRKEYFDPITGGISLYEENLSFAIEKDGVKLYEDYKLTKEVKNERIPYATEFNTYYWIWLEQDKDDNKDDNKDDDEINLISSRQVNYKGKKYWINAEEIIYKENEYEITTLEEYQMYKYNNKNELLNITIPSGTILGTKWRTINEDDSSEYQSPNYWYYVEYENQKGWIYIDTENDKTQIKEKFDSEPDLEEESTNKSEVKDKKDLTPKQTAYIAIGVALLLAIGTAVTIVLINKKKKVKALETPVAEDTKENKNETLEEQKDKE